jgi:O-antigen ligase
LKGVFYPKQRLGLFLAVFAPLYVDAIVRWCPQFPRLWLLLVPMVIVILMSLKRSAWIMLFVGMAAYLMLYLQHHQLTLRNLRLLPVAVVVMTAIITVVLNPKLQDRLYVSSGLFSSDTALTEEATAHRISLWRTGRAMFLDNWLTGVGPRGYRYAYANYASDDDFWMRRNGAGQTHPHLLILEVTVETGVLGLVGLLAFYIRLGRELLTRRSHGVPVWLLCAATAWFPLNAHLAFYGSYWSTLVWILVAIGLAVRADDATGLINTAPQ